MATLYKPEATTDSQLLDALVLNRHEGCTEEQANSVQTVFLNVAEAKDWASIDNIGVVSMSDATEGQKH